MDQSQIIYAGFWKRFLAYIIDEIIMGIIGFFLIMPFLFFLGIGVFSSMDFDDADYYSMVQFQQTQDISLAELSVILFTILIFTMFAVILKWLYYALMESSSKQGTLGKMILNIKVTDIFGNRINFGKASGRYFGKILSALILNIGFIMAAFTERKQALHDMLAGTLVTSDDPYQKIEQSITN